MKTAEIRARFLRYFEKNDHTRVESSSLIPHNDPTLMFANAGMNQFKDVFTGKEQRPYTRATSCQKCVRAGGKHNDLENVGFTARHHTFFEMLGNFSFGDYFKEEAIDLAWRFVTGELQMPVEKLYVTVHVDDDEAEELWKKVTGIPADRISRFDADNFWQMGDTGPCGPCSEIFYDRGAAYGCGNPDCKVGCECDRYMEFWNLVFMQFERDADGKMTPLPRPSVDTGSGLERVAMILQNVETNYDTDGFVELMKKTGKLAGKVYGRDDQDKFSFRVIADHSRATAFLIGDGVLPSNEGRGYVLRRIIRRAIRYGRNLGFREPFLHKTCGFVIDQMQEAYPGLEKQRSLISKMVLAEEEQFLKTLERGLNLLDEEVGALGSRKELPGDVAFRLYDTFGFPLDLTQVILQEKGLTVDEPGFDECMEEQKSRSRQSWKGSGEEGVAGIWHEIAGELQAGDGLPVFTGYESTGGPGRVLALVRNGERVEQAAGPLGEGEVIEAVFDRTPFYGESGGQVGDSGQVNSGDFTGKVVDVQKPVEDLTVVQIRPGKGQITVGKTYEQQADAGRRQLTARNHTATHMLQWALQKVLGDHVKQAGSLVNEEMLRFDFSHFSAMTRDEIAEVERLVNERIWADPAVSTAEMGKDEAIAAGAIAFFGEKYGDKVRVVKVGDFSTELCGGTHVRHTSEINLFKIASEGSVAAGVRRIVALTSKAAFEWMQQRDEEARLVKDRLKAANAEEIEKRLDKMAATEKELRRGLEAAAASSMGNEVDDLVKNAGPLKGGGSLITAVCTPHSSGVKKLREMSERVRQKVPDAVVVLGMNQQEQGKAFLLAAVGKKAPGTVKANDIIKEVAGCIDGRGGGKPDLAQAGGANAGGLEKALTEARQYVDKVLGV